MLYYRIVGPDGVTNLTRKYYTLDIKQILDCFSQLSEDDSAMATTVVLITYSTWHK